MVGGLSRWGLIRHSPRAQQSRFLSRSAGRGAATHRLAAIAERADANLHRYGARVALDGRHAPDAEHALVLRGDRCARA